METLATKLPKQVADSVDRLVASGRFANRSEVLRVAVRAFVESGGSTAGNSAEPPLPPHVQAFYKQLADLAKNPRYRNRWVALHGDDVVDVDGDHDALIRRILERKENPIHVGLATETPERPRYRLPGVRVKR